MEIFPTYPSERGSSEWNAFNMITEDRIDSYPVAEIRIRRNAERKPLLSEPRFA